MPLFLFSSIPISTPISALLHKVRRISMMRGIIYTNLIDIVFPSPFIFSLSPFTVHCLMHHGAQLSSLPKMHLPKGFHLLLWYKDLTSSESFQPCYFSMPCFTWYTSKSYTFLPDIFFLENLKRIALTHKNIITQLSAMCELDSVALNHKGTLGRQRLAQQMLST